MDDEIHLPSLLKWIFLGLALVIIVVTVLYAVNPTWRSLWREGVQNSHEYVSTKQRVLTQLMGDWLALETQIQQLASNPDNAAVVTGMRGQQANIINQMVDEKNLIPASEIPQTVRDFLAVHAPGR